ncbi:putative ribonuclease H-like domain-containing protein, partial [Tanacetum coccineum]
MNESSVGSEDRRSREYQSDRIRGLDDSNVEYLRANLNIKGMSNSRRTSLSNVDYMLYPSLLRTVTDWKGKPSLRSTERSLLHDNIVPKPDLALELGKSISLTEAEEEAVAREVHATHARIVSGPDPEPMQEDQTGSNSGKLHVSLAGPNPEHMDDEFLATAYPKVHENLKLITDERVIEENPESHSGSMSSMKNLDDTYNFGDQFLYDKPTEDDQEKSKVIEESDSTIPDPSHQTVTSTPPVIAPFTDVSSTKPSSLVTPPPINTEATTITTSLPEITPFIALQLRVARLEQEMSEVKKTDHSADVLASIESQVPTAVDKYLGTKLDNALLKVLERHTADLIEKHSVLPGLESIQNQESEKSPKEIIITKREQGEEKQDSTYFIRSTDKVDLEEFDLKSALFKHVNKNKTANRNPVLMEALIADEDAMDKEVAVKVKDHKRKHDSDDEEDDDDDEGPSAGSNQGFIPHRALKNKGIVDSDRVPIETKSLNTIRSDKWYEFMNKDVIEFCGSKGIKREYSNAKTPQQNGVAERKNRTLLRLQGPCLQIHCYLYTFWLVKPVLEQPNKPNIAGKGPTWLFDLDYLTDSMNYHPVRSENQANHLAGQQEANQNAGTEEIIDAGDSEKEDESAQDCFVLPIWPSYSSTITPALTTDDKREGPREEEQVFMDELERLKRQEREAHKEAEALRKQFEQETENLIIQEGAAKPSSTNIFSTVSTPAKASSTNLVNTVSIPVSTASPHEGLSLSDPTNL